MTSLREIEALQADARYYRDRVALLRAKLYRSGTGSSGRLLELERELERAEQRLRDEGVPTRSPR
ncbi:MAG: hypothetical protein M3076_09260 [Actinomycetota bacterium]|nr:hypothetical protein [Actinomycetota bacterium]